MSRLRPRFRERTFGVRSVLPKRSYDPRSSVPVGLLLLCFDLPRSFLKNVTYVRVPGMILCVVIMMFDPFFRDRFF